MKPFYAHSKKDESENILPESEWQLLEDHLNAVARKASEFAATFGAESMGFSAGLLHDVGKYSEEFQQRIRGGKHLVDHATPGSQLLYEKLNHSKLGLLMAYCIMGHHGGLPNGGSKSQDTANDATLYGRLKRLVCDYSEYEYELTIPHLESFTPKWADGFDAAFFVRMLFSALVDADWLDTERFCNPQKIYRGGYLSITELYEHLVTKTNDFLNPAKKANDLDQKRNHLLKNCLSTAEMPSGLFTLTAPTGSGKTISSLAFALKHAVINNKRRIIYVVPYNTIMEQNASVFEAILGVENVLCHNSDVQYDGEDDISRNKRYSVENWDYPLIVASSVQFFESLLANKPSKCRKLHNLSESVLIFDEAQMIPVPFLIPCVRAIKALVSQYGCSAVLATATQSALDKYFEPLIPTEINENPQAMYNALRRTTIKQLDKPLTDDSLVKNILEHKRVMCIVNTRRHAQELFARMHTIAAEGTFHLSTTMTPMHRSSVLKEIRSRLSDKTYPPCRLISTSLVEAGVDLDFDTVFRERAGLDSIIQAAGRCNRESNHALDESIVYVFTCAEKKPPRIIQQNIDACKQIAQRYDDIAGLEAIHAYFNQLFYNLGDERLDEKNIMTMFIDGAKAGMSFPFADAARAFKLIDDAAQQTVYALYEAPDLEARLHSGERSRELFRKLGIYAVSLFQHDIQALDALGAIERLDESVILLYKMYYNKDTGVDLSPKGGQAIFAD